MLSKDLERALNESFKQARAQRHEFITVEHLLLALLDDSAAQHVLKACSGDIEALRGDLTEFIDATTPLVSGESDVDTQPTLGFQRVLQRAQHGRCRCAWTAPPSRSRSRPHSLQQFNSTPTSRTRPRQT